MRKNKNYNIWFKPGSNSKCIRTYVFKPRAFELLNKVFEPNSGAFEPFSQSLTDSRVLILYNLGIISTSEKSSRLTLKHSRLLYIHVSQDLEIYMRYMIYIYIYLRAFMVDNWFLECKIHDTTHNNVLSFGRRPQSSNKSLEGIRGT